MIRKALITGITGQDGSYLAELLLEHEYEVHGIIRRASVFNTERIEHLMANPRIYDRALFLHHGDLTDAAGLHSLISRIRPDEVYNLGAQSHVRVSFDIPEYSGDVDGLGVLRLLHAVTEHQANARIYQASTSEMFGGQVDEMPENGFNEESRFHPRSPYGAAKLYAYWITRNYREAYDTFACNGILFNHESPRRGDTFVTKKITNWIRRYRDRGCTADQPLLLGNLDARRDWGHAKDFVRAQWLILQQDQPDDYVIATGNMYSVREFVEAAFACCDKQVEWEGEGLDECGRIDGTVVVQIHPRYFRPAEVDVLLGDSSRARERLGWSPEYDFEALVRDMMEAPHGA